jgi:hypothetical protein
MAKVKGPDASTPTIAIKAVAAASRHPISSGGAHTPPSAYLLEGCARR